MTLHAIHFMRSVNSETLGGLQNAAHSALLQGATELLIQVSSDGGCNDQGFAAYHFIRSLPVPVTTHCIGNVDSIAVLMYLAGANRTIVSHGKIKIHPMQWEFAKGAVVDHDRLREYVASLDFDVKRYADIFNERTMGAAEVANVHEHLEEQAKIFDAPSAVATGIATCISDAEIPATATRWFV
jgi:ATP-dependent protease ClpP protease subunit